MKNCWMLKPGGIQNNNWAVKVKAPLRENVGVKEAKFHALFILAVIGYLVVRSLWMYKWSVHIGQVAG